jgi:Scramblase
MMRRVSFVLAKQAAQACEGGLTSCQPCPITRPAALVTLPEDGKGCLSIVGCYHCRMFRTSTNADANFRPRTVARRAGRAPKPRPCPATPGVAVQQSIEVCGCSCCLMALRGTAVRQQQRRMLASFSPARIPFVVASSASYNMCDTVRRACICLQVPQYHDEQVLAATEQAQALVVTRNIEMMDLMLGYEQARQLLLKDQHGTPLLALAEQPGSLLGGLLLRQIFDSSRAFTIDVFDVPYLQQYGAAPEQGALP